MNAPSRIFDLHTHLFNARYLPLANIIAAVMDRDESALANIIAAIVNRITGSSYANSAHVTQLDNHNEEDEERLNIASLSHVVEQELRGGNASPEFLAQNGSQEELKLLLDSDLTRLIDSLDTLDYLAEGWEGDVPIEYGVTAPQKDSTSLRVLSSWYIQVLKRALYILNKLMKLKNLYDFSNYLAFFLTMIKSEKEIANMLFDGYNQTRLSIQVCHYMMDMEKAYRIPKSPKYAFYPTQLEKMQSLQADHPETIFGFSAFDPRRDNWKTIADDSIAKGFHGFKFYPAMGYKPSDNSDPSIQRTIDEFFDYCAEGSHPIFVHCTPVGFQTREQLGWNAHPMHWLSVLRKHPNLRLCFGHAGGGYAETSDGEHKSYGWMAEAEDEAEWMDTDNFARIVAELCCSYENVYCEVGYNTELFEYSKRSKFIGNIARVIRFESGRRSTGERTFEFMKKLAYGSDWHMLEMLNKTNRYYQVFLEIFQSNYVKHIDDFFWRNAYRYLSLELP